MLRVWQASHLRPIASPPGRRDAGLRMRHMKDRFAGLGQASHYPSSGDERQYRNEQNLRNLQKLARGNEHNSYPTTTIERFLLIATVALLPLQDHLPALGGEGNETSVLFLMFAALAGYIFLNRLSALGKVWHHPVFLATYVMIALGALLEFSHPHARTTELTRIAQMVVGGIFIAALCRDRKALRAGIYGYLIAGVWMSILLVTTSYGALQSVQATNFDEGSQLRAAAFEDKPIEANLNGMAFIAGQGGLMGLVLLLGARLPRQRVILLGCIFVCFVGTFLPMSRSGILIAGLSCASVLLSYGLNPRMLMLGAMFGLGLLIAVPDAALSRLSYSTEAHDGKVEARARVYTAAVKYLPECALSGIGAGNFWGPWGRRSNYAAVYGGVTGAHNCFIQIALYWGTPGFLALMAVLWQASLCIPRPCRADIHALALLGIGVSLVLLMLVMHDLYAKEFSLGLGLLVGGQQWLWPHGVIPSAPFAKLD